MDYTFVSEEFYALLKQHDITKTEHHMQLKRYRSYMDKLIADKIMPEKSSGS